MPELPEVETIRLGLLPHLEGKRVRLAKTFSPKLRIPIPKEFSTRLTGRKIEALRRRAKYIVMDIDNGWSLLLHLGMSGQVLISRLDSRTPFQPEKHEHFVIETEAGIRLTYRDPRRFGLVTFAKTNELDQHPLLAHLGAEPLSNSFNGPVLKAALAGRSVNIKQALLDQKVVAGLGNIYVSEALYRAGIHPGRRAGAISLARVEGLSRTIRAVLGEALQSGGSSLKDYVHIDGGLGYFQHRFDVYGRTGEACRRKSCRGTIRRIVQGARSTFYCPRCQK